MTLAAHALVILGLTAGATTADAAPDSAVLRFPVSVSGDLPEPVQQAITQAVDEALTEAGFQVTGTAAPCSEPACYDSALEGAGSSLGVQVTVTAQGSDYMITASFLDGTGSTAKSDGDSCDICNHNEVVDRVTQVVGGLAGQLSPAPQAAFVSIVSSPSGAQVTIDGVPVGTTPYEGDVAEGPHSVGVQLDGYESTERTIGTTAGTTAEEAFTLDRASRLNFSPKTEMIIGIATISAGIAAVAGGAVLLAIDQNEIKNDCSGGNVDSTGTCKYRYNTLAGGAALLAGGILASGGGLGLILHSRKRGGMKKAEVAFAPTGVVGRF